MNHKRFAQASEILSSNSSKGFNHEAASDSIAISLQSLLVMPLWLLEFSSSCWRPPWIASRYAPPSSAMQTAWMSMGVHEGIPRNQIKQTFYNGKQPNHVRFDDPEITQDWWIHLLINSRWQSSQMDSLIVWLAAHSPDSPSRVLMSWVIHEIHTIAGYWPLGWKFSWDVRLGSFNPRWKSNHRCKLDNSKYMAKLKCCQGS